MKSTPQIIGALTLTCALAFSSHADPLLKNGDRVVFYGDSITEQKLYTRDIQNYFDVRYPEMKLRFFNAGWGGDVAPRALDRLNRDVLSLNPTVVTLFFGMNDGGYTKVTPEIVKRYSDNMEGIVKALRAKNVRVVVYTPGAVDYDKRPALKDAQYNENLQALGAAAIEIAKKYGCAYADVHGEMLRVQDAAKAKDPNFSMIPDAVHPNEDGHFVMAAAMLRGLGAEAMPPLVDAKIGAPKAPGMYEIKASANSRLPLWIAPSATDLAQSSGLMALAGQRVKIGGLPDGTYEVSVDNRPVGEWSAQQLNAGVTFGGAYSPQAKRLYDVIGWKESNYFNAWRNLRLGDENDNAVKGAYTKLLDADADYQAAIDVLRTPPPAPTITLQAGLPAGVGPNLALKKSYEVSDPNVYNYGSGGLTDGSFSGEGPHTFATGEKDTFPKTATVDLGETQTLGFVRLGVPNFGSTKKVQISLSSDGQNFKTVGEYQFTVRREEKHLFSFAATPARYVRVTYLDHYPDTIGYTPTFAFSTELEAYAAKK